MSPRLIDMVISVLQDIKKENSVNNIQNSILGDILEDIKDVPADVLVAAANAKQVVNTIIENQIRYICIVLVTNNHEQIMNLQTDIYNLKSNLAYNHHIITSWMLNKLQKV